MLTAITACQAQKTLGILLGGMNYETI